MTVSANHQRLIDNILELTGRTNPYNRSGLNIKSEFYIYQMGYLASYLASLCEEDPYIYKRFKQHSDEQVANKRKRKTTQ